MSITTGITGPGVSPWSCPRNPPRLSDLGLVARGRDEDHELVPPVVHDVGDREAGRLLLNEPPGALVAETVASSPSSLGA
jgi:hypothetical protein